MLHCTTSVRTAKCLILRPCLEWCILTQNLFVLGYSGFMLNSSFWYRDFKQFLWLTQDPGPPLHPREQGVSQFHGPSQEGTMPLLLMYKVIHMDPHPSAPPDHSWHHSFKLWLWLRHPYCVGFLVVQLLLRHLYSCKQLLAYNAVNKFNKLTASLGRFRGIVSLVCWRCPN